MLVFAYLLMYFCINLLKFKIMKKLILISTILAVAFSYSCNKEAKKLSTSFSGQLRTNGTEDVIKMSTVLPSPNVAIYQSTTSSTLISGGGYEN